MKLKDMMMITQVKSIYKSFKTLTLLGLFLTSYVVQAQPELQWFNYPGTVAVALDSHENVYTANWDYNPAGDITLTKRDSSGNITWEVPYNNTDNTRHEVATWVETDQLDNVLVSGTIRSGFSSPVNVNGILMKYDGAGNLLWRQNTGADFDGSYTVKCIVDASNNIYVLALGNTAFGMRTQVKKYNPDGSLSWTFNDEDGIGAPQNIKLTSDNAVLIVCRSVFGNLNGVAKIDTDGNLIWNQAGISSLTIGDAIGDLSGNTYVVHGTNIVGQNYTVLEKRSLTGEIMWESNHSMSAFRVEIGPDQSPVISGFPGGLAGVAFAKFNASGGMMWENNDADGPGYSLLAHSMMKIDADGAAYVSGGTMSQMALCKVNSDGSSAYTIESPSGYPVDFDFGETTAIYLAGGTTAKFNTVDVITTLTENTLNENEIVIYPNPSNGTFYLEFNSDIPLKYWVVDVTGKMIVSETTLSQNTAVVSLLDLIPGVYLLNYKTNNSGVVKVERLVVN
jgi:hypothetical protein